MDGYRILLLEDSELDAQLLTRYLEKTQGAERVKVVDSRASFEAELDQNWDCVISDFSLPGFGALQALKLLQERRADVPFIIVSGEIGEENAVEALRAGADDFVGKANLSRLGPALDRAVRECAIRRRETDLRKAHEEAVRERENLLAVVCHDLQNPLAAIRLATDSLLSEAKKEARLSQDAVRDKLMRVQRATDRIDILLRDVLDNAKIESGQFTIEPVRVDVARFWREVEDFFLPLAKKKNVELQFQYPTESLTLVFDERRIFQAVSNLVSNAIKFSREGSKIEGWIDASEGAIRFFIRDFGPGIAKDDLPSVFSKFYQGQKNKKPGSGLGLYIAREIVRLHGGEILVESKVGEATTFWFTLPRHSEIVEETLSLEGKSVMLVDDDEDLRSVMRSALEDQSYFVSEAASVQQASQLLAALPKQPDVLVVDYDLPEVTGAELIRTLPQASGLLSHVILISAHPEVYARARELGVRHVVRKPMKLGRFIHVVNEAMGHTTPAPRQRPV